MGRMMGRIKAPVAEKRSAKLSKQPGMHAVGDPPGLYLLVFEGGRSWILRYSFAGRRRDLGLGSYTDLTLAQARDRARAQRQLILQGIDPIEAKRELRDVRLLAATKRVSFAHCVDGYLDAHGDGWKNAKHRMQWRSTLETYAGPVIGDMNVASVDTGLVLQILEPIWKTKTETASRVRGRIESVLDWARVRGYRAGENPARWRGHLDKLLSKPSKVTTVTHHAALPWREMGAFMADLRSQEGIGAAALEFAILTAARSGEVRGATWDEIDMRSRTWTIPAERMKATKEHRVPLSDAALAVLTRMQKCQLGEHVFPGMKEGAPLRNMSMTAVLRRMERGDLTAHGFRSAFRDWAAEQTNYPNHLAEMALAHTVKGVEGDYRRGDLFDKRARMMADWAKFCAKPLPAGIVVPMKRAAK
ncbi:MAG: integrase [Betaproteobacteria bacterium RBG_16_64_18]|nr:MAG: integrase [Betaproteobacteria bacterium RBG_16_64_18]